MDQIKKMKPAIKKLWVKALRSGKYKKGKGALCKDDKFCCLGVLTDLYIKEKGEEWETNYDTDGRKRFDNEAGLLPDPVQRWAGLDSDDPEVGFKKGQSNLAEINDNSTLTFKEIATKIQKYL